MLTTLKEYERKYGYFERNGKLYSNSGNQVCRTCHVPLYMHRWVSRPDAHQFQP